LLEDKIFAGGKKSTKSAKKIQDFRLYGRWIRSDLLENAVA